MCTCYMFHVVQTWLVRQLLNLIQTPVSFCSWYTRTNTRSSPKNPNTTQMNSSADLCLWFSLLTVKQCQRLVANIVHITFFSPGQEATTVESGRKDKKYFCPCKSAQRIFCKTPCEKNPEQALKTRLCECLKLFRVQHTPALSFSYIRCKYKTNVKAFIDHSWIPFTGYSFCLVLPFCLQKAGRMCC